MTPSPRGFYQSGGALQRDAPCYISRAADEELFQALQAGEFCYLLTARQMGKSSLMVRTAARLQAEGVKVALLDLTALGQNLSAEQWYEGLLNSLAIQIDCEDELQQFWAAHARLGPLQRWLAALREVLVADGRRRTVDSSPARTDAAGRRPPADTTDDRLPSAVSRLPSPASPLVLFIDEIDTVRSLPFSTDEFFAGIRECYHRRTREPEYARLTFCLLGVAAPSDLIRDTRTTPFNIGRRIELADFTLAEAAPLAAGLGTANLSGPRFARCPPSPTRGGGAQAGGKLWEHGPGLPRMAPPSLLGKGAGGLGSTAAAQLLGRILYWTGGHPYLTQRLCQAAAETVARRQTPDASGTGRSALASGDGRLATVLVDRLCAGLFFAHGAAGQEDNLLFVRERLLNSEAERASVLSLYARVRRGGQVRDEATSALGSILRLSGVTRTEQGWLRVRNRIYARVFDPAWVREHMPDAEVRRQAAAYRRGMLRAAGLSAVVLAGLGGLALTAVQVAHRAERLQHLAEARRLAGRRELYAAQMNLAQQACDVANAGRAEELLAAWRPRRGEEDLRGFEWRYLWHLAHEDDARSTFPTPGGVTAMAFTPGWKRVVTCGGRGGIRVWDLARRQPVQILKPDGGRFIAELAITPDGRTLASSIIDDPVVTLWDLPHRRVSARLTGHTGGAGALAFSPDGQTLATTSGPTIRLWDVARRTVRATLTAHHREGDAVAFSPDGRRLASAGGDEAIRLWDLRTRRLKAVFEGLGDRVNSLAFSPDGQTLAAGGKLTATLKLWEVTTHRLRGTLVGHANGWIRVAFSPDGKWLASGSRDSTVRLWSTATQEPVAVFRGHRGGVEGLAFSPDGRRLASGGDETVKFWPLASPEERFHGRHPGVWMLAISADGKTLASSGNDGVKLWDVRTRREIATLPARDAQAVVISHDGRRVAASYAVNRVAVWDVPTRRRIGTLIDPHPTNWDIWPLALSPDGRLLAWAKEERVIQLWDVRRRRSLGTVGASIDGINDLLFSPDGRLLASSGGDRGVHLWDVARRREVTTFRGYSQFCSVWAFSPDGRLLATGGGDQSVKVWDVGRHRLLAHLKGHTVQSSWAGFSPDGRTLATSGMDNQIRLWSVASWEQTAALKEPQLSNYAIVFTPDGKSLICGRTDGSLRVWSAPSLAAADAQSDAAESRALRLVASSSPGQVMLQWQPLPHAVGYNLYRAPGAGAGAFVRLNAQPITGPTFTDASPADGPGQQQQYALAAVFPVPGGGEREGPRVQLPVTPLALPGGWVATTMYTGPRRGSARFTAGGGVTLGFTGTEPEVLPDDDFFLNQPVTGDFELRVRLPARRAGADTGVGLMIRESRDPNARTARMNGPPLGVVWRAVPEGEYDLAFDWRRRQNPRLPVLLRLTRRGSTVTAGYSTDNGRSFRLAGQPVTFDPPLARTVYAGVSIGAPAERPAGEATFEALRILPERAGR